jgi:membrane dipeptidase
MTGDTDRLIDLHVDWLLQYAPETSLFDPTCYPQIPQRLGQIEGYLQATGAAILACYRHADDWARHPDPWSALADLVARIESEFADRLLIGADDYARWLDDGGGRAWGMIGVEGFDALVRTAADLDRLPGLFARGVRLFQPVYTATSLLGGSSAPGDGRGLTDLGSAFLEAVAALAPGAEGPRPLLDLAHLNPTASAEVLSWFEEDSGRPRRLIPIYSHGALKHEGCPRPRAITPENLARLRALGGVIGLGVSPPFYATPEALRAGIEAAAALPFLGRYGYDGIAIGTDFLGVEHTAPGLSNAPEVAAWLRSTFDPDTATMLIRGNAQDLLARAVGAAPAA